MNTTLWDWPFWHCMRQKQRSVYSRTDVQGKKKKKKVINCPFKTSYLLDSTNLQSPQLLHTNFHWFSVTILHLSALPATNPMGNLPFSSFLNHFSLPRSHHQWIRNTIFYDSISVLTKAISDNSNVYLLLIHREGPFQTKEPVSLLHWTGFLSLHNRTF